MPLGKVKSVVSGDTIVLQAPSGAERQLSLAYIQAPRLSSNDPYGYEAREALRLLLVGKQVKFEVLYNINGREYGDVSAPIFDSLVERTLKQGFAKLREGARVPEEEEEKLQAAQKEAEEAGLGVWSTDLKSPEVYQTVSAFEEAGHSLQSGKDAKTYNAIIEKVISGNRAIVRVLVAPGVHLNVPVNLAGVQTPRSGSATTTAEPFGDAARDFVALRLLQRTVQLAFVSFGAQEVPLVTVIHPAGDITEHLLSAGLASVNDHHVVHIGAERAGKLRQLENAARQQALNLWKGLPAAAAPSSSAGLSTGKTVSGTITKVISADTLEIDDETVQLASVRAPRKNDQPLWAAAAKEYVRKAYIGKPCEMTVEAIRAKTDNFEERPLVTVTVDGKNIASEIIANGYATAIRHGKNVSDRSPHWDTLVEKEQEAQTNKKGLHGTKQPAPDRTVNASENITKAKSHLSTLQRRGRISGVVDFVPSGSRFRIISERENVNLTLVLAGINSPKTSEPFGEEARALAAKKFQQRDVEFTVQGTDRLGNFIGHLYLPGESNPFSVELLEAGYASSFIQAAESFAHELEDAEQDAKKARKGIWKDFKEVDEVTEATSALSVNESAPAVPDYIDVTITNVNPDGSIAFISGGGATITKLEQDMTSFNQAAANNAEFSFAAGHPKKNDYVAVKSPKNTYVRAQILNVDKASGKFAVMLIDSGKAVTVSQAQLRPLQQQFGVAKVPGAAKSANLAFVQAPPAGGNGYLEDYVSLLKKEIEGSQLVAAVVSPGNVVLFSIDSKGPEDSVNSFVVEDAYAFIKPKLSAAELNSAWTSTVANLKELEKAAKNDRVGIWEFGDAVYDDEA
ncbi:Staphylococcal nuclease domain-containing protein 1 [Yarrowia sp. B02]|nr:Staphylococcal nuclease domain-containing protein 1 [Yarrowia sp. B02]